MVPERGQATIEWVGVVLLAALALGALAAIALRVDGRPLGALLAHRIACSVRADCRAQDAGVRAAYGEETAALVRRFAPGIVYEPGTYTLPVDFRECRSHDCSDAPDDPDLDAHRSKSGARATAFTRVVRRGGSTYIQYWLYYPDSTTTAGGVAGLLNRAGVDAGLHHADDWESYQVRIEPGGGASVRASSHHGYQGCKHVQCRNRWFPWTGWTRVSRGSHAGHIPVRDRRRPGVHARLWPDPALNVPREITGPAYPGVHLRERTTTGAGLELVPVETLDTDGNDWRFAVTPPWLKGVYRDPESDRT